MTASVTHSVAVNHMSDLKAGQKSTGTVTIKTSGSPVALTYEYPFNDVVDIKESVNNAYVGFIGALKDVVRTAQKMAGLAVDK